MTHEYPKSPATTSAPNASLITQPFSPHITENKAQLVIFTEISHVIGRRLHWNPLQLSSYHQHACLGPICSARVDKLTLAFDSMKILNSVSSKNILVINIRFCQCKSRGCVSVEIHTAYIYMETTFFGIDIDTVVTSN